MFSVIGREDIIGRTLALSPLEPNFTTFYDEDSLLLFSTWEKFVIKTLFFLMFRYEHYHYISYGKRCIPIVKGRLNINDM